MSVIFTKMDRDTGNLDLLAISDHEEGECPNYVVGHIPSYWNSTKCTFCDEKKATGGWSCHGTQTRSCRRCAVRVLPAIIADALVGDRVAMLPISNRLSLREFPPEKELEEVSATFWRAYALALNLAARNIKEGNTTLDYLEEQAAEAAEAESA